VQRPKPFPDAYLRAADLLSVDIEDAVVIEDSPTGLAAGRAAGAVTLGVPLVVSVGDAGAHERWPALAGRTTADIIDLHARFSTEVTR
jgi:beta-phosphoglucomutase-like phosphatase (HAD superfamily)